MHKIDGAGHVNNTFVTEDVATNRPPTEFTADWFNAVQAELVNVIEGAGLALSKPQNTQLLTAINALIKGGDYKDSVRVASTAAINLAAPGANIDGVAMVAGDRFLEKDNATLANRGIYIWNGAAVPATRALDADTGAEFNGGAIIPVTGGAVNANTNWQLTNGNSVIIGTTGLVFQQIGNNEGFNASGLVAYTVTSTALASDIGKITNLNAATAQTLTLPAIQPLGSVLTYTSIGAGVWTIAASGGAVIYAQGAIGVSSLTLGTGESIQLVSTGANWLQCSSNQNTGFSFLGIKSYVTTSTATSADVAKLTYFNSTTSETLTLPTITDVPINSVLTYSNISTGVWTIEKGALGGIYAFNFRSAASVTLAQGESLQLVSDGSSWVQSSGNRMDAAGTLIDFSGQTPPVGYLACPTTVTNISRVTYAALFAAIGTTWGAGDGSTTFGMPFFPADYAAVQGIAGVNLGSNSPGQVINHTHTVNGEGRPGGSGGSGSLAGPTTLTTSNPSGGGAANFAAGVRVLKCVKY